MAVFALLAQPMYGLVAGYVAQATTSICEANTEQLLNGCVGMSSVNIVNLTGNITTTKQVDINKSLTINGNGHTVTAGFARSGNSNDAVFGLYGVDNTATFNNIVIDGGGVGKDLHGVDLYISNAVLNNVTIQNTARTAININGSHVTVDNLTTINTAKKKSWGVYTFNVMELAMGGGVTRVPELTINGKSSHNETAFINGNHIKISSGTVVDTNNQYSSGNTRNLKRTIDAPTITTPSEGATIVDSNGVTLTWSAVNGNNTTQAAAKYNYRLDGVSYGNTTATTATATLANGTYKLEVQAVSASGLVSNWSAVRKFTVNVPQPLNAPTIKGFTHDQSDRTITTRTSGQWTNTNGTSPNTMHMQWNTNDYDLDKVKATKFVYKTPGDDGWKPGATYYPDSANFITSWVGGVFSKHGEGMYEFQLALQNEVGEWSGWSKPASLGYDNTRPEVEITLNKTLNPTEVRIEATDKNLNRIDVSLRDKDGQVVEIDGKKVFPGEWINPIGTNYDKNYYDLLKIAQLSDGEYSVRATAGDLAGNSKNAETKYFTINNTAPKAEIKVGDLINGGTTNDKNIKITGIGTPAEFGTNMATHFFELNAPGNNTFFIYSDKTDNRCTLSSDGNECWFDLAKYYRGDGQYKVRYVVTDKQGHRNDGFNQPWLQGKNTANFTFYVDTIPTIDTINPVELGDDVVVTGTGAPGNTVVVTLEGKSSQEIEVDNNGNWTATFAGVNVGTFPVSVKNKGSQATPVVEDAVVNKRQTPVEPPVVLPPVVPTNPTTPTTPVIQGPALGAPAVTVATTNLQTDAIAVDDEEAVAGVTTESEDSNGDRERSERSVLAAEDTKSTNEWSLVNVLLTVAVSFASLVMLLGLFGSKKDERSTGSRLITLVPAGVAIAALIMTSDFSAKMVWFNVWTWLMAALVVVQAIIMSSSNKADQ